MPTRTKNPLHPSALALNDIQVGRHIIQFNRFYGISVEGVVLTRPYVERLTFGRRKVKTNNLAVIVRNLASGRSERHYLSDLGVIPYRGSNSSPQSAWNLANFTIDVKKRALLPALLPRDANPYESSFEEARNGIMLMP